MANIIADGTTASYQLDTGDAIYVPRDVDIVETTGLNAPVETFDTGARGIRVQVDGTLFSFDDDGIEFFGDNIGNDNHRLLIGETGVVRSAQNSTIYAGVFYVETASNYMTNLGQVSGPQGVLALRTQTLQLVNEGTIHGQFGAGVDFDRSLFFNLDNHGSITGRDGLHLDQSSGDILNSGTILGSAGYGIRGLGTNNSLDGMTLINSGRIEGNQGSVQGTSHADVVVNSGVLAGDVNLSDGNDRYSAFGAGRIDGLLQSGDGDDTLRGAAEPDLFITGNGQDFAEGKGGNDTLSGDAGLDTLFGGAGDDFIDGGSNDDLIDGGIGNDLLQGGGDRDTIRGSGGNDSLLGGAGSDSLQGGGGYDLLQGEAGFDLLYGGIANDTLEGGSGADTLWGQGGEDSLSGGDQSDVLYGGGLNDTLDGGSGFDLLDGGRGEDVLDGSTGNDTLNGGRGDDDLTGGAGADVFVFGWVNGDDVIHDFQNTLDRIDLSLLDVALPDVIAAVSAVGSSAVLLDLNQLGATGTVLIDGISLPGVGGGDFIL